MDGSASSFRKWATSEPDTEFSCSQRHLAGGEWSAASCDSTAKPFTCIAPRQTVHLAQRCNEGPCPTAQSSTLNGAGAARALDGHPSLADAPFTTNGDLGFSEFSRGSCLRTAPAAVNWWRVDLQTERSVGLVKVWNVGDEGEYSQLAGFEIHVGNDAEVDSPSNTVCYSGSEVSQHAPYVEYGRCVGTGRYVFVVQRGVALQLCEVEVYGPEGPEDLGAPHARYRSSDWTDDMLPERGGDTLLNGIKSGIGAVVPMYSAGHGARYPVHSIAGGVNAGIEFGADSLPPVFTICSVTRYTVSDSCRNRIVDAATGNWLHGHWGGHRGVAYYDSWEVSNTATPLSPPPTDWLVMCGKNDGLPGAFLVDGIPPPLADEQAPSASARQLTVNSGFFHAERSKWALMDLMVWDRHLDAEEMRLASDYLHSLLHNGDDAAPQTDSEGGAGRLNWARACDSASGACPTAQSSTSSEITADAEARRGNDGRPGAGTHRAVAPGASFYTDLGFSEFSRGSCLRTAPAAVNWWRVDLQTERSVGLVKVWNVGDEGEYSQLAGFEIHVGNDAEVDSPSNTVCYSGSEVSQHAPYVEYGRCVGTGRYVFVVQRGVALQLCEVEVYGAAAPQGVVRESLHARYRSTDWDGVALLDSGPKQQGAAAGQGALALEEDPAGAGNGNSVRYLGGDSSGSVVLPLDPFPAAFTLCSATRYRDADPATQGRILDALSPSGRAAEWGSNWLHGHWGARRGVAHYGSWDLGPREAGGRDPPATAWLVMCGKNDGSPEAFLVDGLLAPAPCQQTEPAAPVTQLTINGGNFPLERSVWGLAELWVWDGHLSTAQMLEVSDFLHSVLQNGQCGDGEVAGAEFGEECDDGNNNDGDGCSAACMNEGCGDGVVQAALGEECDDGNNGNEDGCSATCMNEGCGDGVVQAALGEECDDGNTANNDGCSAACAEEAECGDGFVQGGEECDDGNRDPGDGCSEGCVREFCGDGIVNDNTEECDDGGETLSCTSTCTITTPLDGCGCVYRAPGGIALRRETGTGCDMACLELDLSGNQIADLQGGLFYGLSNVTTLDLSGNGMRTIQANALLGLVGLRTLILSNNTLTDLAHLGPLVSLTVLDVSGNLLANPPMVAAPCAAPWTTLKVLDVSQNHLSGVGQPAWKSWFRCLWQLEELDLRDNQLASLESESFAALDAECSDVGRRRVGDKCLWLQGTTQQGTSLTTQSAAEECGEGAELATVATEAEAAAVGALWEVSGDVAEMALLGMTCALPELHEDPALQHPAMNLEIPRCSWADGSPATFAFQFWGGALSTATPGVQRGEHVAACLSTGTLGFKSECNMPSHVLCAKDLSEGSALLALHLSHNPLSDVAPGAFRGLARLQELRLSSVALSTLGPPDGVWEGADVWDGLDSLRIVDLSASQLQCQPELPLTVTSALLDPNFHSNLLCVRLPPSSVLFNFDCAGSATLFVRGPTGVLRRVGPPCSEATLYLSGRGLSGFGFGVFAGQNVTSLFADFNNLWTLHAGGLRAAGLDEHLKVLSLEANKLDLPRISPEAFDGLPNLGELILNDNRFTTGGDWGGGLSKLRTLYLSYNVWWTELGSEAFGGLPALEGLDLSGCNVGRIEGGAFEGLDALLWLDLDYNMLLDILLDFSAGPQSAKGSMPFLRGLGRLQRLDLTGNFLVFVDPGALSGMPQLRELSLARTLLTCLPTIPRSVKTVTIDRADAGLSHCLPRGCNGMAPTAHTPSLNPSHNVSELHAEQMHLASAQLGATLKAVETSLSFLRPDAEHALDRELVDSNLYVPIALGWRIWCVPHLAMLHSSRSLQPGELPSLSHTFSLAGTSDYFGSLKGLGSRTFTGAHSPPLASRTKEGFGAAWNQLGAESSPPQPEEGGGSGGEPVLVGQSSDTAGDSDSEPEEASGVRPGRPGPVAAYVAAGGAGAVLLCVAVAVARGGVPRRWRGQEGGRAARGGAGEGQVEVAAPGCERTSSCSSQVELLEGERPQLLAEPEAEGSEVRLALPLSAAQAELVRSFADCCADADRSGSGGVELRLSPGAPGNTGA